MVSLSSISSSVGPFTTKIVGALLILLIGFLLARLIGLMIKRLLHSVALDKNLGKAIGQRLSLERLLSGLTTFLIYAASIIMALNHLGLTTLVLTIITAAIVLILAVSFLLAIRDLLPNVFSGLAIKYRGDFQEGDSISTNGVEGKVEEVTLLTTRIKSGSDILILPNALFQKQAYHVVKKK